jgi:hypothetical protein
LIVTVVAGTVAGGSGCNPARLSITNDETTPAKRPAYIPPLKLAFVFVGTNPQVLTKSKKAPRLPFHKSAFALALSLASSRYKDHKSFDACGILTAPEPALALASYLIVRKFEMRQGFMNVTGILAGIEEAGVSRLALDTRSQGVFISGPARSI